MAENEQSRPAIPAELKRQVLVEAGHRCAIHTCRHPADVDLHHIIPWKDCREHKFENLIALCPNCHRRADAGEIDRKSLVMYKTRLAAPFHVELGQTQVDTGNVYPDEKSSAPSYAWLDSHRRWRTIVERDSDLKRHFEAQLEYPEFRGANLGGNFDALNGFLRDRIVGILDRFREEVVYGPTFDDEHLMPVHFELTSSFAIALLRSNVVSIRFTIHSFAGGAHGSTRTEPVNVILDPFTPLRLESIFRDLPEGVAKLSAFCIGSILKSKTYPHDEAWVKSGAGPQSGNFSKFNLTDEGLLVTFDEYQIDCYAAGRSEVLVPYTVFGDNFDSRFWGELYRL
jgi:hypothetical protein